MAEIKTNKGFSIIVDDEDFEYLNKLIWHMSSWGYVFTHTRFCGKRKTAYIHRIINKTPSGVQTDHVNLNKLDNRKCNLRSVTSSQNRCNMKNFKGGSSRYKGVYWNKAARKWKSSIAIDKVNHYLGIFDDELDAAKCYDVHAVKYHGEFARGNFI